MELNLEPVKVDLQIETPSLERGAFYSLCFITENDEAPRTLEISTLSELLANGYTREDLAYNFCVGVFAQQGIESIFIRAKRSYESYEDAFSADSNDGYYYLVIESKDSQIVSDFNDFVVLSDDYKLQFYSSNEEPVEGRKLVHYFFDRGSDKNDFYLNKVMGDPDYLENVETPPDSFSSGSALTRGNLPVWGTCPRGEASNLRMFTVDPFDESYSVATRLSQRVGEEPKLTAIQLQQQRLAYPEGAWIGLCGNVFPSRVNWLHKNLIKSDIRKINSKPKLPELSSTTMLVIKKRATVGSGLTTQGIVIHEQVSLDWIKWALGRKVWKTLYSNERINATTEGLELIANDVKEVLNLALEEEMLSEYQITEVLLDRYTNNLSLKFSCRLMETILFVDISGSLYY